MTGFFVQSLRDKRAKLDGNLSFYDFSSSPKDNEKKRKKNSSRFGEFISTRDFNEKKFLSWIMRHHLIIPAPVLREKKTRRVLGIQS